MKIAALVLSLILSGCAFVGETTYRFTGELQLEQRSDIELAQKRFSAGTLDITLRNSTVSETVNGLIIAQDDKVFELGRTLSTPLIFGSFVLGQQQLASPYRIEGNVQRRLIAQPRLVADTEACSFAGFCDVEETIEEEVCTGEPASAHDHSRYHSPELETCETKKTTVIKNTWVHSCPGEKPVEITLQPALYQLALEIYSADKQNRLIGTFKGQTRINDEQVSQRDTGACEAIK